MKIVATKIDGFFLIHSERHHDPRGYFARTFCAREFQSAGLPTRFVQSNASFTFLRGTIRGLHYQAAPRPEGKLVSCVRGRVFDVAVDIRRESPTFCQWLGIELSEDNGMSAYLPPGIAHGFQTLTDNCVILYQMTEFYDASLSAGLRWNDPAFDIEWPLPPASISDKDRTFGDFAEQ